MVNKSKEIALKELELTYENTGLREETMKLIEEVSNIDIENLTIILLREIISKLADII
jgi:hypothetical protein